LPLAGSEEEQGAALVPRELVHLKPELGHCEYLELARIDQAHLVVLKHNTKGHSASLRTAYHARPCGLGSSTRQAYTRTQVHRQHVRVRVMRVCPPPTTRGQDNQPRLRRCGRALFPTAISFESGLQQMLMFSPVVLIVSMFFPDRASHMRTVLSPDAVPSHANHVSAPTR